MSLSRHWTLQNGKSSECLLMLYIRQTQLHANAIWWTWWLASNVQSCYVLQESNGHGIASRDKLLWLWGVCFVVCRVCITGCCDWLHLGAYRCFQNQDNFWHHNEKDSHSSHVMTVTCPLSIKCHQVLSSTPVLQLPWCGLFTTDQALLAHCQSR